MHKWTNIIPEIVIAVWTSDLGSSTWQPIPQLSRIGRKWVMMDVGLQSRGSTLLVTKHAIVSKNKGKLFITKIFLELYCKKNNCIVKKK